jgi:hypothetical protein
MSEQNSSGQSEVPVKPADVPVPAAGSVVEPQFAGHPIALASFPRSGNSLLRSLIEKVCVTASECRPAVPAIGGADRHHCCNNARVRQRMPSHAPCVAARLARPVHRTSNGERQPGHDHAVARSETNGLARLVGVVALAPCCSRSSKRAPVPVLFVVFPTNALCRLVDWAGLVVLIPAGEGQVQGMWVVKTHFPERKNVKEFQTSKARCVRLGA